MPLVRVALRAGKSAKYRQAIGEGVHRAMVETINAPPLDRFQIITEHDRDSLIYDPAYLDIPRTDDVVFIQITLHAGRSVEQKRKFFKAQNSGFDLRFRIRIPAALDFHRD